VTINRIDPQPVEPGALFDTYRYRLEILGHYDQLGEYLSDIASLPRVVVPQDLSLKRASQGAQRLLADTVGQLLEADVALRTFVKAAAPPPPAGRRPGASTGGGQ
jgi:Tfp pilus assembly protein PilO